MNIRDCIRGKDTGAMKVSFVGIFVALQWTDHWFADGSFLPKPGFESQVTSKRCRHERRGCCASGRLCSALLIFLWRGL